MHNCLKIFIFKNHVLMFNWNLYFFYFGKFIIESEVFLHHLVFKWKDCALINFQMFTQVDPFWSKVFCSKDITFVFINNFMFQKVCKENKCSWIIWRHKKNFHFPLSCRRRWLRLSYLLRVKKKGLAQQFLTLNYLLH